MDKYKPKEVYMSTNSVRVLIEIIESDGTWERYKDVDPQTWQANAVNGLVRRGLIQKNDDDQYETTPAGDYAFGNSLSERFQFLRTGTYMLPDEALYVIFRVFPDGFWEPIDWAITRPHHLKRLLKAQDEL